MNRKRSASQSSLPSPHHRAKRQRRESRSYLTVPQTPKYTLFVHGSTDSGQLGIGTDFEESSLMEIPRPRLNLVVDNLVANKTMGPLGVESLAAGGMHSLLVDSEGKVWSWGVNDEFSLGRRTKVDDSPFETNESRSSEYYPRLVSSLEGFRAVQVAAGDGISLALSDKGELRAWGSLKIFNDRWTFDNDSEHPVRRLHPVVLPAFANLIVTQISCGTNHALALANDGLVYAWGDCGSYQTGRMIDDIEENWRDAARPEMLHLLYSIVLIGTGWSTSFAVNSHGLVFGWGLNRSRQVGVSDDLAKDSYFVTSPTLIKALNPEKHNGAKVIQIAGGEFHTLFLFENGEVWGCGQCDEHALGLSDDHPALIQAQSRAKDQSGKIVKDILVHEPVRVFFPPPPTEDDPVPDLPPYGTLSSTRISSIDAGGRYSFACSEQGILYSWGVGTSAQLGLGSQEEAQTPTRVRSKELSSYRVSSVSCGGQFVLTRVIPAP